MGVIMIRCPQTGHEIPTGIEMDTAEFQRARHDERSVVRSYSPKS